MSKISISVYKITINKKKHPDQLEHLNDFANGNDLLDLVETLPAQFLKLNSLHNVLDEAATSRRTVIPRHDLDVSGRIISGYITSGNYGLETPVVDNNGDQVYKVSKNHSPVRPFFFFIYLPKKESIGYLLIQRFENFGVYSILSKMLRDVFNKRFADYTLSVRPDGLDNSEALSYVKEGKITKAAFAIYDPLHISKLFTNRNQNDNFSYDDVNAEIVISAKRNRNVSLINTITNYITSAKPAKIEITDQDIPFEKFKVYVKVGNTEKILDLSKWETFSKDIDVTHLLKYDSETGHPLRKSIGDECHSILTRIIKKHDKKNI